MNISPPQALEAISLDCRSTKQFPLHIKWQWKWKPNAEIIIALALYLRRFCSAQITNQHYETGDMIMGTDNKTGTKHTHTHTHSTNLCIHINSSDIFKSIATTAAHEKHMLLISMRKNNDSFSWLRWCNIAMSLNVASSEWTIFFSPSSSSCYP